MSLVQSLAKVAVSVAAAKGIASVMNRVAQPTSRTDSRPGHEDHPNSGLGGKSQVAGFGSLLEQLGPAAAGGGSGSNAMARASAGNLDASISGLAQAAGAAKARTTRSTKTPHAGSFAEVLNQSFQKWDEPAIAPTPQQNAAAGLMLRAMLQAAKCDGRIDEGEKKKIFLTPSGALPAKTWRSWIGSFLHLSTCRPSLGRCPGAWRTRSMLFRCWALTSTAAKKRNISSSLPLPWV